jgi:hypothetical protein
MASEVGRSLLSMFLQLLNQSFPCLTWSETRIVRFGSSGVRLEVVIAHVNRIVNK